MSAVEWVEITARTVEEALDRALDQLGVDVEDAEIEVLEEPKAGLFGKLRGGQARVRARIRPSEVRPKVDRRESRKRGDRARGDGASRLRGGGGQGSGQGGGQGGGQRRAKADQSGADDPSRTDRLAEEGGGLVAESGGGVPGEDGRRQGRGSRDRGGIDRASEDAGRPAPKQPGRTGGKREADVPELTIDEQADVVAGFLRGLASRFGVPGTETAIERVEQDTIEIRLTGGDLGLLIGPKGQTLQLVQELARIAVQRRGGGTQEGRIRIDIAGYRERRREALTRFANDVAAQVLASGTRKALEPMNPADRKVVHDTVNDIEGVRTISEGEDARRRVVLVPDDG